MPDISIRWRQGPFVCELRFRPTGAMLYIHFGSQLVRTEPVPSASAGYDLAVEVSKAFRMPASAHG